MSENLFAGSPDERQALDKIETSRFRPRYRALDPEEKKLHDEIKNAAVHLESLIAKVPAGRYPTLALTALEESVMWAVKGLTA